LQRGSGRGRRLTAISWSAAGRSLSLVGLVCDAEQGRRESAALLHVPQNNCGLIADIVDDHPLAKFDRVGGEDQLDRSVFGVVGILGFHAGGGAVLGVADHHFGAAQVDVVGQDQVQRGAFQGVLFGGLVGFRIEDRNLPAPGEDEGFVGRGVFKPGAAGAFDKQLAGRDRSVGVDLSKLDLGGGQAVQIGGQVFEGDFVGHRRKSETEDQSRGQ
jgi:hypothetical protein